jgi:hypothetical protein
MGQCAETLLVRFSAHAGGCMHISADGDRQVPDVALPFERVCFNLGGSSSICVVALAVSRTAEDHLS